MASSDLNERFSRQVILPGVGAAGQQKWAEATILLAGEGPALEAAQTAFKTSGVSKVFILPFESFELVPSASLTVVVTENKDWRRKLSRRLRAEARPALFGWPAGSGYALFLTRHQGGRCPCLECFEVLNPKAFSKGSVSVQRQIGALAASEALQWILKGESPLEGKVWITSLDQGVSFHHDVQPSYKCPARLLGEGAVVAP